MTGSTPMTPEQRRGGDGVDRFMGRPFPAYQDPTYFGQRTTGRLPVDRNPLYHSMSSLPITPGTGTHAPQVRRNAAGWLSANAHATVVVTRFPPTWQFITQLHSLLTGTQPDCTNSCCCQQRDVIGSLIAPQFYHAYDDAPKPFKVGWKTKRPLEKIPLKRESELAYYLQRETYNEGALSPKL